MQMLMAMHTCHWTMFRHQLMAFSFPAAFDYPGSPLALRMLIQRLQNQIQEKLTAASAGSPDGWREVEIQVDQNVNLERVAL